MPAGREPQRTCVGCRGRGGRHELVRVVRAPDGTVAIDLVGSAPGRGAYVHPRPGCLERAARGETLARALKAPLEADRAATLMRELMEQAGETR